jgi:hypothetical protein
MAWVGSEKIDMAGENTSSQAPSREGRPIAAPESDIRLTLPAQGGRLIMSFLRARPTPAMELA